MERREAWRVTALDYADQAFNGEGARRYGGRFNSPGVSVIYAASSLPLAVLEVLVRLSSQEELDRYVAIPLSFSEELLMPLEQSSLPEDWRDVDFSTRAQRLEDTWSQEARSLVLEVPSAVLPTESNYLINPTHPAFDRLEVGDTQALELDLRLTSLAV